MSEAMSTLQEWRALVEKDLKGVPFEKALVSKSPEGIAVQPLYTEAPALDVPGMPTTFSLSPWGEGRGEGSLSSLDLHESGADAADEISILLSSAVAELKKGKTPTRAEISLGRDTFAELAKLRALRLCWNKLMTAAGHPGAKLHVHAVCSRRTLTQRDPWVNMLRTTTQVFAGILGGADEITPTSFDAELTKQSDLGRRVAQNTGLILEHESSLGRVIDPAAGSYYLDTFTDQLAREGWKRFQELEKQGGLEAALPALKAQLEKRWTERLAALATRKIPVLGVSEFANVEEKLPSAPREFSGPGHRDAESFERLRMIADRKRPSVMLVTLGTFSESRGRAGFSSNFFAAGGFRVTEMPLTPTLSPLSQGEGALCCICGSDERYATDAAAAVKTLRTNGWKTVLIAGKPQDFGSDGHIFMGCDVVGTLAGLLEVAS
ncbi:MAG: methylmalonyl-CoA mutase family protein [Myxococcaceae bacterium]